MNNKRFDKTFLGLFKKSNEIILHKNLQTIEKYAFNIYPFFLTFNITTLVCDIIKEFTGKDERTKRYPQ